MEFIDLKSQQKLIREKLDKRLNKVLNEGRYILGQEVSELEKELSIFSKSQFSVGCSNGTDALMLCLLYTSPSPRDS